MRVSTEEAALMVAATNMTKKVEAIEAELVAAHAALEVAAPECRECRKPVLTDHAIRALEALAMSKPFRTILAEVFGAEKAQALEDLWRDRWCSEGCKAKHAERKEQAASWEAENVSRFKAALRVVKEES